MRHALLHVARFAVLTLIFAGAVSLSAWPRHRSLPEGTGVLVLSFSHGADRKAACRKLTAKEIAELPPNMRRKELCPRERPSVHVQFYIDGVRRFDAEVPPSGIAGDGPSRVHQSFVLPVGTHDVKVRLRDRPGDEFDWEVARSIEIGSATHRVIDFRPESGGFIFH